MLAPPALWLGLPTGITVKQNLTARIRIPGDFITSQPSGEDQVQNFWCFTANVMHVLLSKFECVQSHF